MSVSGLNTPTLEPEASNSKKSSILAVSSSNLAKRPVARRACLACREKKIKCDGEPPVAPGTKTPQSPKVCSNCKYLGIDCVFVQSNRGGRRRKGTDDSGTPRAGSITSGITPTASRLSKTEISTPQIGIDMQTRNQLDFLHSNSRENHSLTRSPSIDSQSNTSQDSYYRGYPPYRGDFPDSYGPPSPPYRHHRRHHHHRHHHYPEEHDGIITQGPLSSAPPPLPPNPFHGGPPPPPPPPPPPHHHDPFGYGPGPGFPFPPPHPHRFGYGPPPPPPPPPPFHHHRGGEGGGGKRWRQMYDHYQLPPPQALLAPIGGTETNSRKRTSSVVSRNEFSEKENSHFDPSQNSTSYRSNLDDTETKSNLFAKFDLPDLKTCGIFIDLFYKYIQPSIPVFNSKLDFLERFSPKSSASILHCMFAIVCSHAPPNIVPNSNYRDPNYWFKFIDKHWSNLDTASAISGLLLLFHYNVQFSKLQDAFKCLSRSVDIIEVYELRSVVRYRDADFYQKMSIVSTKEQLIKRLKLNRLIWLTWQSQLLYNILTESTTMAMKFPSEIELPSSSYDVQILNWKEIQVLSANDEDLMRLDPYQFAIIVAQMGDDFIRSRQSIDRDDFNSKLSKLIHIAHAKLYKITSLHSNSIILEKRLIVVNHNILRSAFLLHLMKIMNNFPVVSNWFMFKPLDFVCDLHRDVDLNFDINDLSQNLAKNFNSLNFKAFFTVFKSSLAMIKLLNLGYGITEEDDNTSPVVIGPTSFIPSDTAKKYIADDLDEDDDGDFERQWWSSFDDPNLVAALKDSDVPDAWIAYPFWMANSVSKNVCILASITLICKFFVFVKSPTNPDLLIVKRFTEPLTQTEHDLELNHRPSSKTLATQITLEFSDLESIPLSEFNLNRLASDLRLCYKFLKSQARYSVSVNSGLVHIERIVEYVDEVLKTIG